MYGKEGGSDFKEKIAVAVHGPHILIHQQLQRIDGGAQGSHAGHDLIVEGMGHGAQGIHGIDGGQLGFQIGQGGGGLLQQGIDLGQQLLLDGGVGVDGLRAATVLASSPV